MPWTPGQFQAKHDKSATPKQAARESKLASAMLKSGASEGVAIATAIDRAKGVGPKGKRK
jgi:hypothetical protein